MSMSRRRFLSTARAAVVAPAFWPSHATAAQSPAPASDATFDPVRASFPTQPADLVVRQQDGELVNKVREARDVWSSLSGRVGVGKSVSRRFARFAEQHGSLWVIGESGIP